MAAYDLFTDVVRPLLQEKWWNSSIENRQRISTAIAVLDRLEWLLDHEFPDVFMRLESYF